MKIYVSFLLILVLAAIGLALPILHSVPNGNENFFGVVGGGKRAKGREGSRGDGYGVFGDGKAFKRGYNGKFGERETSGLISKASENFMVENLEDSGGS